MNAKEFKKAFDLCLLELGFTKESATYYKRSDEVICAVGLQKSNFEDTYYVNVAYVIRELHPNLDSPRDIDGDIRTRFLLATNGKEVDQIDPGTLSSAEELKNIVRANVTELIEGRISISGVKSLLANYPALLYQTTVRAKRALGLEVL